MSFGAHIKPALRAVFDNWKPMVLIQLGAVALVIAYYQSPGLQAWCANLAEIKQRGGVLFVGVVGAFAGGIIPEIAKLLTRSGSGRQGWKEVLCVAAYFAAMGMSVDLMYKAFGVVYGMGHEPLTVLKKTSTDMGVFCPLVAVPSILLIFTWKDFSFSWPATFRSFRNGGFWDRYVKVILPNWMMWIPVVSAIYCLPVNLQFLTGQLAEAAWSIVIVHISQNVTEAEL